MITTTFEQYPRPEPPQMSADCSFSSVLEASLQGWMASGGEDTLLSLALPLDGIDPLQALPVLADQASFQLLMDGAPGLCLAAAGSCQQLELAGARRFELAQRFADLSLSRLVDTSSQSRSGQTKGVAALPFLRSGRRTPPRSHAPPPLKRCCPAGSSPVRDAVAGFASMESSTPQPKHEIWPNSFGSNRTTSR